MSVEQTGKMDWIKVFKGDVNISL